MLELPIETQRFGCATCIEVPQYASTDAISGCLSSAGSDSHVSCEELARNTKQDPDSIHGRNHDQLTLVTVTPTERVSPLETVARKSIFPWCTTRLRYQAECHQEECVEKCPGVLLTRTMTTKRTSHVNSTSTNMQKISPYNPQRPVTIISSCEFQLKNTFEMA